MGLSVLHVFILCLSNCILQSKWFTEVDPGFLRRGRQFQKGAPNCNLTNFPLKRPWADRGRDPTSTPNPSLVFVSIHTLV